MLAVSRQGSTYHFRRAVPVRLRHLVGQAEFWASLGTTCRKTAWARAAVLYDATEKVLSLAREAWDRPNLTPEQQLALLQDAVIKEAIEVAELIERRSKKQAELAEARALIAEMEFLQRLNRGWDERTAQLQSIVDGVDRLVSSRERQSGQLSEARRTTEMLTAALGRLVVENKRVHGDVQIPPSTPPRPAAPVFSSLTADHLAAKTEYSEQTRHQSRATFRLWVELMGDGKVDGYTGRDAGRFQEQLRRLPASHGKAVMSRVQLTAPEAIERADASPVPVPRLSEKTIKRHISTLSQYWVQLRRWEHVARNIFEGMEFPGTAQRRSKRDDWAPDDIGKLLAATWRSRSVPAETYKWVTVIAAFSGMRLEEICRLRPVDVSMVGDTPFILIQEHPDGWSPKSEARARAVPVHPRLVEVGFLDLVAKRKAERAPRLMLGLRPGGANNALGWNFSREFGKHKLAAGVSERTVFHSWRHSVSTILRNAGADIRSEWIDACLGHEGGAKSMGATVYLKRIGPANLAKTMAALRYEPDADPASLLNKNLAGLQPV